MKNVALISLFTLFFSSESLAQDAEQAMSSVSQLQSYSNSLSTKNFTQPTVDITCGARAGWEIAVTGLGNPEQCAKDSSYVATKGEWISIYSSIKYR